MNEAKACGAAAPDIDATCSLPAGHEGEHYTEVEGCYVQWRERERAPYEPPAIESTARFERLEVSACHECGSFHGFCHPACSSQGRD